MAARGAVTIVLPSLEGGGAERATALVASGLAARGARVVLVLARAVGPYLRELHRGVEVLDLRCASMATALPGLVRHLRAERPAAVFAAMTHTNIAVALAHRMSGSRARLVLGERVHVGSALGSDRGLRSRLTAALMRMTYPWADRVIAVSEGVAANLAVHARIAQGRIVTIYNPIVDQQLLQAAAEAPRHRWLQQAAPPVLLAAGRLTAQKDFETLLLAFSQLRRRRQLRLVILGEGEQRPALQSLAQSLGVAADVDMPGFEANPFSAMRAASVFVLSSRFEGLPGTLIQAMACGVRVVATDCPSGPSEILEGGRWGRLVPVGDATALAEAIAATLDDPMPPDVRARAGNFTVERAVDRYAQELGLNVAP
jgi:glycosyltransferase involved in cell wall biosynthesis